MNYIFLPHGLPLTCILSMHFQSQHVYWSFQVSFFFWSSCSAWCIRRYRFLFSLHSAGFSVANAGFHFQVGMMVSWFTFSYLLFVFAVQVCCDGLLLGLRSWRKTQVSAAGAMSNWISCSIGSLRLKLQKKIQFTDWEKAWHTSAAPCITRTRTRDVYKATLKGESTSSKTLCLRMP